VQELIDAEASEVGIAKSAAAETIDAFLATVTNAMVKSDAVQTDFIACRQASADNRDIRRHGRPQTRNGTA
jgi:nucleoid DNA-binding protein